MPAALSLDSIVALRADVTTVDFDGEVMLVDNAGGRYHAAGSVGSRIVALLDGARSVGDIVGQLCAIYVIDRKTCGAEVLAFLAALEAEALLGPPL